MSVTSGAPTHPTQVQLETTLRVSTTSPSLSESASPHAAEPLSSCSQSTLHALSLILSFYSSVQQLGVLNHTPHAPRQLTNQLKLEAAKYDQICGQLEANILRAIATLERDALKAAQTGQLVLPHPPQPTGDAPPAGDSASGSNTGETPVIDLTTGDASISETDTNMTDVGFLDLTGDASATSAAETAFALPAGTESQTTTATTSGEQPSTALSLLGLSVPAIESSTVELADSQDLSALLGSIVTDASFPSTTFSADATLLPFSGADLSSTSAPADLDLNAMLTMLSGANAAPASGAGGETDLVLPAFDPTTLNLTTTATTTQPTTATTEGQGAQGMEVDLDSLDFSNMDPGSLDELLKSLGAGEPA
ncbi:BZ3500_MvSof-1268-A1-R1_Chr1-1g01184 [Microbotryum saponariae]|uniref:BZ3500_MvSof-1268-A1-R1_Chr1-1g01184 protein n=1 Tax=Microbotryum saponariae TaxID=289078 RepID=A0A2X0ME07_9BASI|nr:BZ3500_MvSof-1268-A1-R1_Chr1-1g01184 [Microbotryum saponariae]SCZ93602.1 BZ3501_MvSof-1269-A2-R1_Chr1-1g00780 [Microbotryum saponariae]